MSNFIRLLQRNSSPPQRVLVNIEEIQRVNFYKVDGAEKADFILKNTIHTVKGEDYETTIETTIAGNDIKTFVANLKNAGLNIHIIE